MKVNEALVHQQLELFAAQSGAGLRRRHHPMMKTKELNR